MVEAPVISGYVGDTAQQRLRESARGNSGPKPECPRVAVLTPYSGDNFGDAAIQDALIANLRSRVPSVRVSGITLNCSNFLERHGVDAFPLCAVDRPFYGMTTDGPRPAHGQAQRSNSLLVRAVKRGLKPLRTIAQEIRHILAAYKFLRGSQALIVSGGGQLDEEWGGPWGLPYSLFKWALVARAAKVPYLVVSVGAGRIRSKLARFFLKRALSTAQYRSYRDGQTKTAASHLLRIAESDAVVPDLAFAVPLAEPDPAWREEPIRRASKVVAISPIVFMKPGLWPCQDLVIYQRYVRELSLAIRGLLERDYEIVFVWSALSDKAVIPDLMTQLKDLSGISFETKIRVSTVATWREFVRTVHGADVLIASRLHSVILGCVSGAPLLAISFDPKVDWVMADLGQTQNLLQIATFTAADIIGACEQALGNSKEIRQSLNSYVTRAGSLSAEQYDFLAELTLAGCRQPMQTAC